MNDTGMKSLDLNIIDDVNRFTYPFDFTRKVEHTRSRHIDFSDGGFEDRKRIGESSDLQDWRKWLTGYKQTLLEERIKG